MRLTLAILLLCSLPGCVVKSWSGDVYECPKTLIERVSTQLQSCETWQKNQTAEPPSAP